MKLFVVAIFLFVIGGECSPQSEKKLENVVRQILKISPPEKDVDFKDEVPPKHMLQLYQRFTSGRKSSGETVRSITPFTDGSGRHQPKDTLVFNVSQLGVDEEVRAGQLMLRRRRVSRSHARRGPLLAPPCRVRLYHLAPHHAHRTRALLLASIPVPQTSRGGWHSVDITAALKELFVSSSDTSGHFILGVRFEAPKAKIISPAHFLDNKDNTAAFLMVFTDETSENEISNEHHKKSHITPQHIQILTNLLAEEEEYAKKRHTHYKKEINPKRHKHIKIEEENGDIKELIDMERIKSMKRHKYEDINSVSRHEFRNLDRWLQDSETRRVIRSADSSESKPHKRRSIYDNELPYEKLHIHKEHSKLETDEPKDVTTEKPNDDDEDDKNLIPYPPGMKRKRKKKNRRGKKRNQRSKTSMFDEWHQISNSGLMHGMVVHEEPRSNLSVLNNHTCSLKKLQVTFKKLGWHNIIAPTDFHLNYCTGSCGLPARQRPANFRERPQSEVRRVKSFHENKGAFSKKMYVFSKVTFNRYASVTQSIHNLAYWAFPPLALTLI